MAQSPPASDHESARRRISGKTHVVIAMHEVNEVFDGGRFVAHSPRVPLPPDGNGAIVHRMTWPRMGGWICEQVLRLLEPAPVMVH